MREEEEIFHLSNSSIILFVVSFLGGGEEPVEENG